MLSYDDFSLGILLTNNQIIKQYNAQYRKKDAPTDILSFAAHQVKPGERVEACCDDEKELGDLVISLEYVKEDAPRWKETMDERMQTLLVHGIFHLLGYDHESDAQYAEMNPQEKRILKALGRNV
jgi:probable rRNA maturation factor